MLSLYSVILVFSFSFLFFFLKELRIEGAPTILGNLYTYKSKISNYGIKENCDRLVLERGKERKAGEKINHPFCHPLMGRDRLVRLDLASRKTQRFVVSLYKNWRWRLISNHTVNFYHKKGSKKRSYFGDRCEIRWNSETRVSITSFASKMILRKIFLQFVRRIPCNNRLWFFEVMRVDG